MFDCAGCAISAPASRQVGLLFDALGEAAFMLDVNGVVKLGNREARALTGESELESGLRFENLVVLRDEARRSRLSVASLLGKEAGAWALLPNGADKPVTVRAVALDGGVFIGIRDRSQQYEREARLSEFTRTLDLTLDCVFMYRAADLRFIYVNAGGRRQVGYSEEELLNMTVLDLKRQFTATAFREMVRPLFDGKQSSITFRTTHRHKDGHDIPVEVCLQLVVGVGREPRFVNIVRDITDRLLVESALKESETLFRDVIDSLPACIGVVDRNGRLAANSRPWAEFPATLDGEGGLGLPGGDYYDLCRRPVGASSQRGEQIRDGLGKVLTGGAESFSCEYPVVVDNERQWWKFDVNRLRRESGGAVVSHTNITRQKTAEKVLEDFKAALDEHGIVAITDPRGRITYVNDRFCAISKFSREELIGKDHRIISSGYHSKEFIRNLWRTIKAGRVWRGEMKNRAKDGSYYWVDTTIVPFLDAAGRPTQYIAIRADITASKEAEALLQQSNRALEEAKLKADSASQAKSRFLANMSHEIRTPMNAILGYSQLMLRDRALGDGAKASLRVINQSGEHLLGLIDNVLDMSKIEAGRVEVQQRQFSLLELFETLEAMFRLRAAAKNLRLDVRLTEVENSTVMSDVGKVRQILVNLLSNAVKFTDQGRISLFGSLEPEEDGQLWFLASVTDTGIGMSASELNQLFRPFTQTHAGLNTREGTGLGLALSRDFARLLGGDITVESTPGMGTTFRLRIPTKPCQGDPVSRSPRSRLVLGLKPGQRSPRILVVDDRPVNSHWLEELLCHVGFEARCAESGEEAIAECHSWLPHVILMDIHMPGMDGLEATRRIKADPRTAGTLIIALSASTFEVEREAVTQAGADGFLPKPCQERDLFAVLGQMLNLEFLFSDGSHASDIAKSHGSVTVDSAMLVALPNPLRAELYASAVNGDRFRLEEIIRQVGAVAGPDLAAGLLRLAENYEYESITNALEAVCQS
ncbi:MAG: PAS domain S-box protein [Acidobacteria bacterium]|nr:PAS domain S-box protein [Acidobacteriota bacterium]